MRNGHPAAPCGTHAAAKYDARWRADAGTLAWVRVVITEIAWEGPASMSAGRVDFAGEVDVASFPHTETIVVVDGELSLSAAGAAPLVLRRGEGAVVARGTALRVLAASRTRFVFCAA